MKSAIAKFFRKLKIVTKLGINELRDPYYHGMGGQLAFYLFMSTMPVITLMSQLLKYLSLPGELIQTWAKMSLTDLGLENLESLLIDTSGGKITGNILLILTTIWAASRAQFSLTNITDYIILDGRDTGLNFFKRRGRAYLLIIMMLITICLTLILAVYLPKVLTLIFGDAAVLQFAGLIFKKIRWLIVMGIYFIVIACIYFVSPTSRVKFHEVIPGAIFASIGFVLTTAFYSLYMKFSISKDIIYGTLSNVIILMMWFFIISWVICLGAVVNKLWGLAVKY